MERRIRTENVNLLVHNPISARRFLLFFRSLSGPCAGAGVIYVGKYAEADAEGREDFSQKFLLIAY